MIDTSPLPAAVKGGKDALTERGRAEIAALSGPQPMSFTRQMATAWLVIVAASALAIHLQSGWMTVLAVVVVATRQNVLGLLVHEQAHLLGYRGRHADLLVNLFAAYPLLVLTVEGYAQVHLAHHRDYFSESDPDFLRKSGEEWSFPKRKRGLTALFLRDALGLTLLQLVRGKSRTVRLPAFARRHAIPRWVRPAFYSAAVVVLTLTGSWSVFLVYWLLPLLFVFPVLVRWGAMCEHKYNLPGANVASSTPLIVLRWWERVLLPNLNFGMHPYHHFFPNVAFSRLPQVHRIYCREQLVNHENVFAGYAAYFRFVTRPPSDISAKS